MMRIDGHAARRSASALDPQRARYLPATAWHLAALVATACAVSAMTAGSLHAQNQRPGDWVISSDRHQAPRPPGDTRDLPPWSTSPQPSFSPSAPSGNVTSGRVQRGELAPIRTGPGDTLPSGAWRGLDLSTIEQLIAPLRLPNRSPQLHQLWRSILTARDAPPPARRKRRGHTTAEQFALVRAEALYRSGQLAEAERLLHAAGEFKSPVSQGIAARILLARREFSKGCEAAKAAAAAVKRLPRAIRGEAIAIAGYCAIHAGNRSAGKLAAELARSQGYRNRFALTLLKAIGTNRRPDPSYPKHLDVIDGLLLEAARLVPAPQFLVRAEPALLAMLASPSDNTTQSNIVAAEEAARRNVIDAGDLAAIYRGYRFANGETDDALGANIAPTLRRAALFQAAERIRSPLRRTRLLRALVDDARRYDLTFPTLQMIKPLVDDLPRKPEIGWFAETAIEATLAAGDASSALSWTIFSAALDHNAEGTMQHWRSLIDIAHGTSATNDNRSLASVESLAARGQFSPEVLHRLATVLDALDYNVPIPLWERASKTPQPKSGHLPPTGVLSQLKSAAQNKEIARVVLLSLRTIGPDGAAGANIIALGDCIRALKRAGLEPEARRLGFEALFGQWPRNQYQ